MSTRQSMYQISGQLVKVYCQQRTDRDTGEVTAEHRCNVLGEIATRDGGDFRLDLQDIRVPDEHVAALRSREGQNVTLPVGLFSPAKGQVILFIPKGSTLD